MNVLEAYPTIERIAQQVAADYPDVEWEDVRQELCKFVIEKGDSLVWEGGGGSVKKILRRVASSYCKDERTSQQYLSSQYSYRPSDVMKILETAWDVTERYVPEDAQSLKADVDGLDLSSDVKQAMSLLSEDQRLAIFSRYYMGIIPEHASYDRKRLNAAIRELTKALNSYRGHKRKVVSNARAAAIIANAY